jgi:hypothetical protein
LDEVSAVQKTSSASEYRLGSSSGSTCTDDTESSWKTLIRFLTLIVSSNRVEEATPTDRVLRREVPHPCLLWHDRCRQ